MSDMSQRRYDLDWLRIGAFGLLILYHIGMFYVSWPWHVKSSHASQADVYLAIQPLMLLTNPWRLALLFLIAGCATRFMADKMARGRMARARSWRLLLPLAFGMLVIVPPQTYYEIVEKLGYGEGWAAFYLKYVSFHGGWRTDGKPLIVPTWNHLWFVLYLWVYTMIVIALRPLLHRPALLRIAQWCAGHLRGVILLLLPVLFLGILRLTLRPIFGQTHALVDDWYLHAMYFSLFLLGYAIAKAEIVWDAIERLRWVALTFALAAYIGMVSLMLARQIGPQFHILWAFDQWMWIVMLLGFARRWLSHDGPVSGPLRRYLTDAIFPFYILHQTVIVVLGHHLTGLGLPAAAEATILVTGTALACWAGYELVRRVAWWRPVFGLQALVKPNQAVTNDLVSKRT